MQPHRGPSTLCALRRSVILGRDNPRPLPALFPPLALRPKYESLGPERTPQVGPEENAMKKIVLSAVALLLMSLGASAQEFPLFDHLKTLDGQVFEGRMNYSNKVDDPMDQPMTMRVEVVSDDQIRIPFAVGEDRSRTWILTRTDEGLQLKHDHRQPDGTPDDLTNYGGTAQPSGLGNLIVFPADAETVEMLPEAASNHWSFRMSAGGSNLFYYLERHAEPRFEVIFDLVSQSAAD